MGSGLAIAVLALGVELAGFEGALGIGRRQLLLAGAGAAIGVLGALLDLIRGGRELRAWFADRFTDARGLLRFLLVGVQLGLLLLVMRQYEIESRAFYHTVLLLAGFGFLLSHLLPQKWRLLFFLTLSLGGISGVLGTASAVWLVGGGVLLVGVCYLPASFRARVLLIVMVAVALTVLRMDLVASPIPGAIWPILGSMFMFRLIVFLYDFQHQKSRPTLTQALSYFFLLPNVVFPLFPVVDFQTFRRNYFDAPWAGIYQRGIHWMFRGLTHLLLYRLLNHFVMIAPEQVASFSDLLRYLLANFLLYLRVSGQFHIIIGMLHLFGFRLPETNNKYCLSSSFTDFWRRINIYWKDFMIKVFYYPAYFKLQKRGAPRALLLATAVVFAATWVLHAYQWFWLRGSFLLSVTDVLFWAILGLLMLANTWWESKRGRKRTLSKGGATHGEFAVRTLRTAGTFTTIVVLWSLWSSPSVEEWFSLLQRRGAPRETAATTLSWNGSTWLWLTFAGLLALAVARKQHLARFFQSPLWICLALLSLFAAAHPFGYSLLPEAPRQGVAAMRAQLTKFEADQLQRGYYENLTGVEGANKQLRELYTRHLGRAEHIQDTAAGRHTGDFVRFELVPSTSILFNGQRFSTNRWGMRDRHYELIPPPDHFRIAVLGPSTVAGWGVADNETFESVLEEMLNRNPNPATDSRSFEVLNFGMGGHSPPEYFHTLEHKALPFQPRTVFYVAHTRWDLFRPRVTLMENIRAGVDPPYDFLREILSKSGVDARMPETEILQRLSPFSKEIVQWTYKQFVTFCRERGIQPVFILLPISPGESWWSEEAPFLAQAASDAGFFVFDLMDVFDGYSAEQVRLADWDRNHSNPLGNRLIAERLNKLMRENPEAWAASERRENPAKANK